VAGSLGWSIGPFGSGLAQKAALLLFIFLFLFHFLFCDFFEI
jgi:hypothetical protein